MRSFRPPLTPPNLGGELCSIKAILNMRYLNQLSIVNYQLSIINSYPNTTSIMAATSPATLL